VSIFFPSVLDRRRPNPRGISPVCRGDSVIETIVIASVLEIVTNVFGGDESLLLDLNNYTNEIIRYWKKSHNKLYIKLVICNYIYNTYYVHVVSPR